MAEREGFEPSRGIAPPYRFSKPTPSATWVPLRVLRLAASYNFRILNQTNYSSSYLLFKVIDIVLHLPAILNNEYRPCTIKFMPEQEPETIKPTAAEPQSPANWNFVQEGASNLTDPPSPDQKAAALPPSDDESISWTANEFLDNEKTMSWYLVLVSGSVALALVIYLLTKSKFTAIVVLLAGGLMGFSAGHKPRALEYRLDNQGLTIGQKFYSYDSFRSFDVFQEGKITGLELSPLRRFMPELTIYLDPTKAPSIVNILSDRLPAQKSEHDFVDKFIRRIRF